MWPWKVKVKDSRILSGRGSVWYIHIYQHFVTTLIWMPQKSLLAGWVFRYPSGLSCFAVLVWLQIRSGGSSWSHSVHWNLRVTRNLLFLKWSDTLWSFRGYSVYVFVNWAVIVKHHRTHCILDLIKPWSLNIQISTLRFVTSPTWPSSLTWSSKWSSRGSNPMCLLL